MIFSLNDKWFIEGNTTPFNSEEEAIAYIQGSLPLPEVREYDSMEEAIAAEDVE